MKIINKELIRHETSHEYTVKINENRKISFIVWSKEDNLGYEGDWEFASDEDKEIYKMLSEEEQDEFMDLIGNQT